MKVIGYYTHIVASCKLPADEVYTMTKTIAANTKTLATVAKDIGALTPKGMARGHRRAVPSGRRQVLQGSRHHGEDQLIERARGGKLAPALGAPMRVTRSAWRMRA